MQTSANSDFGIVVRAGHRRVEFGGWPDILAYRRALPVRMPSGRYRTGQRRPVSLIAAIVGKRAPILPAPISAISGLAMWYTPTGYHFASGYRKCAHRAICAFNCVTSHPNVH